MGINVECLKKSMITTIFVKVLKTKENDVLHDLNNIPEVIESDIVLGSYEIMCCVAAPTYNDISSIVAKIRKIEHVKATVTLNVIK